MGIAMLGAGLGILNYYRSVVKDRVNLKLNVSHYIIPRIAGGTANGLNVEVINLGFIPVTISNAYIELKDKKIYTDLSTLYGQNLPARIESRESMSIRFAPELNDDLRILEARSVLVKTACGIELRDSGKLFKNWVERRRKGQIKPE
jgi:hypothetical protein